MTATLNRRSSILSATVAAVLGACVFHGLAQAESVSKETFRIMAARCAPAVQARTLYAVAVTESDLDPWALHDNTTGISEDEQTFDAALVDAQSWVGLGHSVDIGLMQVNSGNLSALNMTVRTALDPCASMAGGAAVLQAAYGGADTPADRQAALLVALSRYNTGSPLRGILNGYARRVLANAGALAVPLPMASPPLLSRTSNALSPDSDAPPPWNVGAVGIYAQTHGAPWLVALRPPSLTKVAATVSVTVDQAPGPTSPQTRNP